MKKVLIVGFLMALAGNVYAQIFPASQNSYSGYLANESALTQSKAYVVDLATYNASIVSAVVTYGSATIQNLSFQDGSRSTGSITIVNYLALSSASPTDNLTVASTAGISGAAITIGNYTLTNGVDWFQAPTATGTALSIAKALGQVPYLSSAIARGAVVYSTAVYGTAYNGLGFSSNDSSFTFASPTFSGGVDNAVLTINGVALTQGTQWTAATSSKTTAMNLANAISASSMGSSLIISSNVGGAFGIINATSTLNGTAVNYTLVSSTPTAMSVNGPAMAGGTNAQFVLNGKIISSTVTTNLTVGLPVLYSIGGTAIGGLTNQTTYYAVPLSAVQFELSKYSTSSLVGADLVVFTSTNSQLPQSEHTYTLAPLGISGTPGFAWQVSNDNTNWFNLAVSSVTMTTYTNPATVSTWDFPQMDFRYLRMNTTAPTTGGIVLHSFVSIKQQGITHP